MMARHRKFVMTGGSAFSMVITWMQLEGIDVEERDAGRLSSIHYLEVKQRVRVLARSIAKRAISPSLKPGDEARRWECLRGDR